MKQQEKKEVKFLSLEDYSKLSKEEKEKRLQYLKNKLNHLKQKNI